MLCIPSPDVLLNLFASAAQLLGLLALCLGGSFVTKRRHPGLHGRAPASAMPLTITVVLLVGVSSAFLLYHLSVVDAENRRLRANLVRSSTEEGKKVGDVNLKTLSYSGQIKLGTGVTTDQLAEWLATGKPLNLIDVREDEEVEMGGIAGAWHRRYPDLQADTSNVAVPGKETVLICESGNRSSELHLWLQEQGIATRFVVGGYEKWVAEDREIQAADDGARDDLRALPDFPNKEVLLTTDEVVRLYTEENVLFVDVRYPGDYDLGHLPGAVCVPLRKLKSDEARTELAKLPRGRPIVAPCYDKRSSFYALILGVRLSRMGYDFRGRYTVPHEFTLPKKESEWVAKWNAANAERTLFGTARNTAVAALGFGTRELGSLALAIVAIALLLRVLMLPLSLKADRDGVVQARLKPVLRELRARFGDDPLRASRASVDLLRRERITPLRNFFASLATLLLFAVVFGAVDRLSETSVEGAGWLRWSEPDPYWVLPSVSGVLLLGIAWLGANGSQKGRVAAVVFAVVITALVVTCRAGVQLYLVVSFAVMLLQSLAVRGFLGSRGARAAAPLAPGAVVPLRAAGLHPQLGGKAVRLGQMVAAGFEVPQGFVVAPGPYDPRALDAAFGRLGVDHVAVRSSAQGEDGEHSSFAGSFHTELRVRRGDLVHAVEKVRASYGDRQGGVLVQVMIEADHAGVLFTEDPAHAGRALVEMVAGTAEALVSGTATPTEHRFGRVTGERVGTADDALDLEPLLAAGRSLERVFGAPQDVEWAHAGGRFVLLQSRHITARAGDGADAVAAREAERARLLQGLDGVAPEQTVFVAGDHATLLPEPTALSLELMQAIHAPGGAVDHACRRLGLKFTASEHDLPAVRSVFGRCCADVRAADRIRTGAGAAFRLGLRSPELERNLVDGFLPEFLRAARLRETMALEQLSLAELHELRRDTWQRFVTSTYVEAEIVNLATEAYVAAARRDLDKKGLDAAALLGQGVHTIVGEAWNALTGADGAQRFLALFGHRAGHDFELSEPRFRERPRIVARMASSATPLEGTAAAAQPLPAGKVTRTALLRARRFTELKELAKHAAMHDVAFLRRVLLAIGARTRLQHRVFELTTAELDRLVDGADLAGARVTAERRARERAWLLAVPLPQEVSPAVLERIGEQQPLPAMAPRGLRGLRVAGDRDVTGIVRVLHDPSQLDRLAPGDILVVRYTDPCWMPAFRRAGGLVSEVGGWLSHASIQAREHNLPAIVGVANATVLLRDGDRVCLRRDGSVEAVSGIRIA